MYKGKDGRVRVVEVKTQFGSVVRPLQKFYPLEVTTVDSLSSTERNVENGSCLYQDQIPEVQEVLRSRYGRLLKQTKRLVFFMTFILTLVTAVLDSSTSSNPKVGECHKLPSS
ncbi:hypothetical protein TNCT_74901 [Trichonephila clavata]|uniref:Uncharacterized protein n=1 Tax=Trichonephila clavata TaxID=2740835 RepID=A0A8X6K5W5_TRICU|nr:hypothetical protein TNCT_74901 [Trichonephila clavata]